MTVDIVHVFLLVSVCIYVHTYVHLLMQSMWSSVRLEGEAMCKFNECCAVSRWYCACHWLVSLSGAH